MIRHSSANTKVPVRFWAQSHTSVIDYDEACLMHLTSVPQLPKGCGWIGFLFPMHRKIPDPYAKREGGNPGILVSHLKYRIVTEGEVTTANSTGGL